MGVLLYLSALFSLCSSLLVTESKCSACLDDLALYGLLVSGTYLFLSVVGTDKVASLLAMISLVAARKKLTPQAKPLNLTFDKSGISRGYFAL